MKYIRLYNLTENNILPDKIIDKNNIGFVIATDDKYYQSARAVIHGIRKYFGNNSKIIYYDLGGTMNNDQIVWISNLVLSFIGSLYF